MIKNFNLYKEFKESSLYGRYITNDSVYKLNDIYSYEESVSYTHLRAHET